MKRRERSGVLPADPASLVAAFLEYEEVARVHVASRRLLAVPNICAPSPDLVLARGRPAAWYEGVEKKIPDARVDCWRPTPRFRRLVASVASRLQSRKRLSERATRKIEECSDEWGEDAPQAERLAAILAAARTKGYQAADVNWYASSVKEADVGVVFEFARLSTRSTTAFRQRHVGAMSHLPTIDYLAARDGVRLNSIPADRLDDVAVARALEKARYARALKWGSPGLRSDKRYVKMLIPRIPDVYLYATPRVRADRDCALAFLRASPVSIGSVPVATLLDVFFDVADAYRQAFFAAPARRGLLGELSRRAFNKIFDRYFDAYPADLFFVDHDLNPRQASDARLEAALNALDRHDAPHRLAAARLPFRVGLGLGVPTTSVGVVLPPLLFPVHWCGGGVHNGP